MTKHEDFMKAVFFNLKNAEIDVRKNNKIGLIEFRNSVKTFFEIKTNKSVGNAIDFMTAKGWLEKGFNCIILTKKAVKDFG